MTARPGYPPPAAYAYDGAWRRILPPSTPGPPNRPFDDSALVFDTSRDEPLAIIDRALWHFDGDLWRPLETTGGEVWMRRTLFGAFAHDASRGVTIVHNQEGTWELSGTTWTQQSPESAPPPRTQAVMAFDSDRGRTVLFGGRRAGTSGDRLDDTWEWDGANWIEVRPETSPPSRYGAAMAYDSSRHRMVLYGGIGLAGDREQYLTDLWEYDGSSWQQATVTVAPPQIEYPSLAYDPVRQTTLLWGRQPSSTDQIWEYDGRDWIPTPHEESHPDIQYDGLLAYDPVRGGIMLYGPEPPFADAQTWIRTSGEPVDGGAGPDDGGVRSDGGGILGDDGGVRSDGGSRGDRSSGCGCRVGARPAPHAGVLVLLATALGALTRRRRR